MQLQAFPGKRLLLADCHGIQSLGSRAWFEAGAAPFSWLLWKGHFGALMGSIW